MRRLDSGVHQRVNRRTVLHTSAAYGQSGNKGGFRYLDSFVGKIGDEMINLWRKTLSMLLLTIGLTSCTDVVRTQPYLVGTFSGTYQPDNLSGSDPNNPPSLPIVVESRLVSTAASRYTFEGAVSLDGMRYSMTGYEENLDGEVVYLQPQARGIFGNFIMVLQNEIGSSVSICGFTYYGLAGSNFPPLLQDGKIVSGAVASVEACYKSRNVIGSFGGLQKQSQ